ncbi:MAG: phage Gp37/Gp68 family protein [Pseudomonadota bacterium]
MGTNSKIEWTEATWNPVAGCSIISPGCTNCYAMRMAERLEAMGQPKYDNLTRRTGGRPKWNGNIRLDYSALGVPGAWKQGRMIFVNSMADLFHEEVPLSFIRKVFNVMRRCPQHTFQVLTKRSKRLTELSPQLYWAKNIWMGVSVESAHYVNRIDHLRLTDAAIKFLSLEPLIGDVGQIQLDQIHWAIAGGESGPGARFMDPEWVRSIRDQCLANGVAFHFKQWGGVNKKKTGRVLDGRTWDEFPIQAVA